MGLFDQFFGKKKIEKNIKDSQYLPEKKEPVHIEFAQNFVARGGKFVYCESPQDTHYYFQQILNENGWTQQNIIAQNQVLSSFFQLDEDTPAPKAMLLHCEYLIANKGAILICNRQIQDQKLSELPENLIIIASTNAFKSDVSEAMTAINQKYKNQLPTNITTFECLRPYERKRFFFPTGEMQNIYIC